MRAAARAREGMRTGMRTRGHIARVGILRAIIIKYYLTFKSNSSNNEAAI